MVNIEYLNDEMYEGETKSWEIIQLNDSDMIQHFMQKRRTAFVEWDRRVGSRENCNKLKQLKLFPRLILIYILFNVRENKKQQQKIIP